MQARRLILVALMLVAASALAQQAPPPPPASENIAPPATPGLSPELADATKMIRDGDYVAAQRKIEGVLATDARNPQARFLGAVLQTDQGEVDLALATFKQLTQEFPELPEPYNNLAVILAQQGRYDQAKVALESALAAHPDYAIAHENLGDIYSRLAGAEYDRALALDKTNKSAQAKLVLVRELYAVAPSANPPKLAVPVPKPAPTPTPKK